MWWIVIPIVTVIALILFVGRNANKPLPKDFKLAKQPDTNKNTIANYSKASKHHENIVNHIGGKAYDVEHAITNGDWDRARFLLQKIAYGMVGNHVSADEKVIFKEFMTRFAQRDPLYREMMPKITKVIAQNKGMLQRKIYAHLPNYDTETIRYILYFADELGNLVRVKKGRSYQLYLIGATVEGEVEKQNNVKTTVSMNFTATVTANDLTEKDLRIRELLSTATEHKKINWDFSIKCLQEVQQLMSWGEDDYGIETYLRLPLYLQQAGRMPEAVIEFNKLLDASKDIDPPYEYAVVLDKMRLAYKREKDYKQAVAYGMLYAELEFAPGKQKDAYIKKVIEPLFNKIPKPKV